MFKKDTIEVSDKFQLIYLTAKGFKPIDTTRLPDNRVVAIYKNDKDFKNALLDWMVDEELSNYRMAEKKVEQLIRSVK